MTFQILWAVVFTAVYAVAAYQAQRLMAGNKHGPGLPKFRATTRNAEILYPFQRCGSGGGPGALMGHNALTGDPFSFDPWRAYTNGEQNPNGFVIGTIGSGKSSLLKTMVRRHITLGRYAVYIDPKGETGRLAQSVNSEDGRYKSVIVKLQPGGNVCINPLDAGPEAAGTIAAIVAAKLNRALTEPEQAALAEAVRSTLGSVDRPVMSDVRRALLDPSHHFAESIGFTREALIAATRDVSSGLWNLCSGPMSSMFDGPTTVNIDWSAQFVAFDLSELFGIDDEPMRVVMAAVLGWVQPILRARQGEQRFLILDEAWYLLNNAALARWVRAMFKFSRQYGLSNWIVLHRLGDLAAAGTEAREIAVGLIADTGTKIVYRQDHSQLAQTRDVLDLNPEETRAIGVMPKYQGLWRSGQSSVLVHHEISRADAWMVDTDDQMRVDEPADPDLAPLAPVDDEAVAS